MAKTPREQLIDNVLEQIARDVENEDVTAIQEMIAHLPDNVLEAYLPLEF